MSSAPVSVTSEIDKIFYSIANELDLMLGKLSTDAKLSPQDFESFVSSLERRDHALGSRFERAQVQKVNYQIPEGLKQRLLHEIFQLSEPTTRAKVEQFMAKYALFWNVLKKIEDTIRTGRYKVIEKMDKSEPGGGSR